VAITTFLSPDPDSRTPEHEGRRIEVIDGGWRLLNHEKYRAIRDEESTLESKRRYINTRRAKEREEKTSDVEQSRTASNAGERSRDNAEAYTEAEADTEEKKNTRVARAVASACPADVSPQVFEDWSHLRKAKKSPITKTALVGVRRQAEKAGLSMQQALEVCCERGWSGFKAEWITERSPVGRQAGVESRNAAVVARILKGGPSEQG
jgi:hypothetical protein